MFDAEGRLEQQRNVGLMVAVPIFLLINALFAYVGGRMMSKLEHKSSEDVLTAHYLGGRSFGPIVSMGTMVRSCEQYVTSWKEIALHQKTYHDEGLFLSSIDHTHKIITFLITPTFCYSLPVSSRGSRSSVFQTVLIQVDGLRSSGLLARSSLLPYTVE